MKYNRAELLQEMEDALKHYDKMISKANDLQHYVAMMDNSTKARRVVSSVKDQLESKQNWLKETINKYGGYRRYR